MRVSLKEFMDNLGVAHILTPYETCPWSVYSPETGATCCAEVRMGPEGTDLEAEIQLMRDDPAGDLPPMEQIFHICAVQSGDQWKVISLLVRGEPYAEIHDIYNWQEKACNFFRAVVQDLATDEIPDFDALLHREIHDRDKAGDQSGSGGGKSPKMRGQEVLGIKKGGNF